MAERSAEPCCELLGSCRSHARHEGGGISLESTRRPLESARVSGLRLEEESRIDEPIDRGERRWSPLVKGIIEPQRDP